MSEQDISRIANDSKVPPTPEMESALTLFIDNEKKVGISSSEKSELLRYPVLEAVWKAMKNRKSQQVEHT